jgi:HlyD family secretion protein
MMNRETSIYSSDTLVVTDRSRERRRWVIIGTSLAVLLVMFAAVMIGRGST